MKLLQKHWLLFACEMWINWFKYLKLFYTISFPVQDRFMFKNVVFFLCSRSNFDDLMSVSTFAFNVHHLRAIRVVTNACGRHRSEKEKCVRLWYWKAVFRKANIFRRNPEEHFINKNTNSDARVCSFRMNKMEKSSWRMLRISGIFFLCVCVRIVHFTERE